MALIQTEVIAYVTPTLLREIARHLAYPRCGEYRLTLEDGAVLVLRQKEVSHAEERVQSEVD